MKNLIKIQSDCYFISQRIKEIDRSYEIYYNLNEKCFEVHSNSQVKNSYCFKVPYDTLDERTITFAYKTSVCNMDEIIKEIDKHNQLLYEKNVKNQVNLLKEML